ncbi:ATP-binding protein [Methanoregula sp.]|jgi:serine/threonine-protein kinase RsbW|uniref:ATP-binding protein n=1 Tax=Methanoregula sp. TaxID=2052170 RepID=UPI003C21EFF4
MQEDSFLRVITSDINEIPEISACLETLMRAHGFPEDDILDTQLAVEEAITNIIVHGYRDAGGEITVSCRAGNGNVEVRLEDRAGPFDPLTIPEPDLASEVEERKIGGIGIFLIRQVMDEIRYRFEEGKNILVLTKRKKA